MKFKCTQNSSRQLWTSPPKHFFFEKKRATRNEKFSFWKSLLATVIFKLDLGDGSISWPQAYWLDQSPLQLPVCLKLPGKNFSREKCLKEKLWKIRWKLYFKEHGKILFKMKPESVFNTKYALKIIEERNQIKGKHGKTWKFWSEKRSKWKIIVMN